MANGFSNFPPDLYDGELWLPSKFNPQQHHPHHHPISCTDDLAHRLAALSLPKHHQKLPNATHFQRLKEPVRYGSVNGTGFEMGPFFGVAKPVYAFQFLKPTQARVKSYVEARARVMQWQQNTDYKFGLGGGLVRGSGGTGVFHPRIVNTTFDSKNKRSLKDRVSQESQRMKNSMKSVDDMNQEDCYYHLPPEIGFA